jgi:hypothetical protein
VFVAGVEIVCARDPPFDQDWNCHVVDACVCGEMASSERTIPTTPVNE